MKWVVPWMIYFAMDEKNVPQGRVNRSRRVCAGFGGCVRTQAGRACAHKISKIGILSNQFHSPLSQGAFTPVLAKHTKSFNLVDRLYAPPPLPYARGRGAERTNASAPTRSVKATTKRSLVAQG
jgi:hypothetical protein